MQTSPWTTHSIQTVYDNPWITVYEDQVTTPTRTPGIYGRVCMKNKALGVIPLDEDGNTWIVGQYRYTLGEYSWEIPMGGGSATESLLEAAQRELLEETGIRAQRWDSLARIHTSNSVTDEEGFVYLATQLSFTEARPDETEDLKVRKLPAMEAVKMVRDGRITDAISMIGLLRLAETL